MGGSSKARAGLRSLAGRSDSRWLETYRVVLFGKGYATDASRAGRSVDAEKARAILESGGKVPREEALRCRVRYFSDGAVLGSRLFVQSFLEVGSSRFTPSSRDGPKELKGSDWEGLSCLRSLRTGVF